MIDFIIEVVGIALAVFIPTAFAWWLYVNRVRTKD